MYSLLRSTHVSNLDIRKGKWNRSIGRSFSDMTIGVIGAGRVGTRVIDLITKIGCKNLLVSDIYHNESLRDKYGFEWASKEKVFSESDIITFHVPLTADAKGMVKKDELLRMKKDAFITISNPTECAKLLAIFHTKQPKETYRNLTDL